MSGFTIFMIIAAVGLIALMAIIAASQGKSKKKE